MRPLISALIATLLVCASGTAPHAAGAPHASDIATTDLTQQTCALYVSIRSAALDPVPFGRMIDDGMVRWNKCPGGTMVACVKVPTANGDSLLTGIHWRPRPTK